jgi:hypothetical protein
VDRVVGATEDLYESTTGTNPKDWDAAAANKNKNKGNNSAGSNAYASLGNKGYDAPADRETDIDL